VSQDPTPTQALLIFGLLARHGECRQAELIPAIQKADRDALEKARLIGVTKQGQSYILTLTDGGWAWAAKNPSAELPQAFRPLSDLLTRLGDYLQRSGHTLADVIGAPQAEAKPQHRPTKEAGPPAKKPPANAKPKKPKPPTLAEIRKQIETAYLAITGGQRNRAVLLSRLGSELPDLPRPSLDEVFARILKRTRGYTTMSLMRHDDPRQLSQADHAAAYNPAGEPFHVIWIAS
jgi:hypothetical protein